MPTETIGRYEVESVIGRGAMAVVYKAVDPTIGRTVALKTMRFDVHGIEKNEVLSRFRNEARAAGKLLHPNLVTIYDAGEQEGTFYIAMECVEGNTLQALLSEQRFLTLDRTIDIMTQICAGLDYAHANGVIHRDIKPANIMITRSGVVKIMDFGIAKSGAQLTTGGDVLGTPNYISPEMVKGDPIDGRSDLFSAAVILHEMLLGERPFTAPNISTIIYKIVNEPLPPDLETKVHPAVAAILRKALSKHPSDRYQAGADLVGALKSYQALLTQPIPTSVVPGTPIVTNWPAVSPAASAAAPKLSDTASYPRPQQSPSAPPGPTYQAPEVFGSDVPEVFRAPVSSSDLGSTPYPPPMRSSSPPPPANPVPASFGPVGMQPAVVPPPIFGAKNLEHETIAPPPSKSAFPRILIVAVVTVVVIAAGVFGYRAMNDQTPSKQQAPLTVVTPDPVAITQTESAKGREETSKIDASAAAATVNKANAAPAATKGNKKNPQPTPAPAVATVAPPPVVPGATTADLAINSNPAGASVQLDGQNRGEKTPFTASGMKAGSHTVIFTRPGYQPMTRTVEIAAGNNASLNVNLAVAPTGIAFESTPAGAQIFVDDEPTGKVTPATVTIPPGSHSVSIFKQGFDEGTGNVHVGEGELQHFAVVLQPGDRDSRTKRLFAGAKDKGMIIVRSRPRGAQIRLEDMNVATTPARIIVRNGKAHLLVTKDGYKPFKKEVQVDKGDIVVVDATLEPVGQ
ncbi:serine/threonine-protein kinase [Candidatus Korobacter versatilis]|nr:serine/threonine-protein kinase [Candidatus Koribacter versatilis]